MGSYIFQVLGATAPGEGIAEDLPWALSLLSFWSVAIESRVTEGQGCSDLWTLGLLYDS